MDRFHGQIPVETLKEDAGGLLVLLGGRVGGAGREVSDSGFPAARKIGFGRTKMAMPGAEAPGYVVKAR